MTKKFSIILPVRNGGQYVKECVASILNQTINDFNLIVLDNASNDGTLEWIQSLNDDRIKIYPSNRSLTIEENWHRILSVPKNEFVTLIGHDDILDPHYLATMNKLIDQHPKASLYQTHFRYIDSKGNTLRRCKPMDDIQHAYEFLAFFLADIEDTMGTGFMLRSIDYDREGGIPPYPNLLFADFQLWINITKKSYKATALEECFGFRLHQSTTTTSPDIKFQKAFEKFVEYLMNLRNEDHLLEEVIKRYAIGFISKYCKGLSHRLLRTPRSKREGVSVASFIKSCKSYADSLVPDNLYEPLNDFSLRTASLIDSNFLLRYTFGLFKKIYPRPILS